jgi:cytochrome P450
VRRYGDVFALTVPVYGRAVVVAEPELARQVFSTSNDEVGCNSPNLGGIFGSGSVFGLDGAEHLRRRRLLTPPFHGRSVKNFEQIIVEETLRECNGWPEGQEFAALPAMLRIGLKVILRAVFGAQDSDLDELERLVPPFITLGSRLAGMPTPRFVRRRLRGRYTPWGRFREYRRRYDGAIVRLIENVRADPDFDSRSDVLSLLLKSTYEDGAAMTVKEISDELLTLVAAGHESTGATLGWTFERITRHPNALAQISAEALTDDNEYRRAVLTETQRVRTVVDFTGRRVHAETFRLGEWVVPRGTTIIVSLAQLHARDKEYPDPHRFDPERFTGSRAPSFAWLPYGGGTRRCPGAIFANVEMDVVLRTVLRHFSVEPTSTKSEEVHARGVTFMPKDGARIRVHRRR